MEGTNDLVQNPMPNFNDSLATVQAFFAMVDSGTLFQSDDATFYSTMRGKLLKALSSLLVWERPALETTRGIMWPYHGFARRRHIVSESAEGDGADSTRKQAQLFLALLPFPGQWSWLRRVEAHYGNDPEVKEFLAAEEREISRKIHHKSQNHYKLRHFCQVLKSAEASGEKGILRIFSLPYLVTQYGLLPELSRRYVIFVEPPMGVVFRHHWWRFFAALEDPCVMGVSSTEDMHFLQGQQGVEAVQLAHGDFLEDLDLSTLRPGKQYDIAFNASFDDLCRKRHALMLQLLQHPLLRSATALFLGRGAMANVEELQQQVARAGLESRVTIMANLRRTEVPAWLARCRMGVHLSLYENACRSIYEFFRSDLPCVISSSMGGMNPGIFNAETGMAVPDADLPEAISFVLRNGEHFAPRQWFLNHSGSRNSSRKLNKILREFFERWGYDWRGDIVPLVSSGASRYSDVSDFERFRPEFQWILERFKAKAVSPLTFSVD